MGPQSDNRGYGRFDGLGVYRAGPLQWVPSLITGVMIAAAVVTTASRKASMGPQSDNRGYVCCEGAMVVD